MTSINAELSASALALVPELRVCAVIVHDLDRVAGNLALDTLAAEAASSIVTRVPAPDTIATVEPFASWRSVFAAMGLQPSKFRSSVEALSRRTLKAGLPQTGIPAVDAYNAISVKEQTPMGGYDVAKLNGSIVIRPLLEGDEFSPLGGDPADFPMKASVLVYAENRRVLCYAVNHRDSRETAITMQTNEAVFFAECLANVDPLAARRALENLARTLQEAGASRSNVFDVTVAGAVATELVWDEMV